MDINSSRRVKPLDLLMNCGYLYIVTGLLRLSARNDKVLFVNCHCEEVVATDEAISIFYRKQVTIHIFVL